MALNSGRYERNASWPEKETSLARACNSETLFAVANETRKRVLIVSCLKEAEDKGSKAEELKYLRTKERSQGGARRGTEGLSILKDLIRSLRTGLEEISGRTNLKAALSIERYPAMAEYERPFDFLR